MGKISKTFTVFLTLIIGMSCLSLLTINPANAQTIPKPSVPQFTVEYTNSTYTVSASTTIDPYTGETITHPSSTGEKRTFELAIRNQPFAQYVDSSSGRTITLMYQIRTKGQFEQNWTNLYFVEDGFLPASNSDYTTVSYPIYSGSVWGNLEANSKVDFQVQAMIGYITRTSGFMSWYLAGESSDWSPKQTVIIPESSGSPSPSPTVPELSWLAILPLLLMVLAVAVTVRHRKVVYLNK